MSEPRPKSFFAPVGIETAMQYRQLEWEYSEEISELQSDDFEEVTPAFERRPIAAVGLLMSEKTGLIGIKNRHGQIYPLPAEAEAIGDRRKQANLSTTPLELIIHYNTDHPENIGEQLERATAPYRRQESLDGVQVNNLRIGHLDGIYKKFKAEFPSVSIILQIHGGLMDEYNPQELARALDAKRFAFDHLWLDGSGGEGRLLDSERLLQYIEAIRKRLPGKGIGVAGGLNPDNLEESLSPILEQDADISWDAQSGVQSSIEGNKHFDVDKATRFMIGSLALRSRYPIIR